MDRGHVVTATVTLGIEVDNNGASGNDARSSLRRRGKQRYYDGPIA